MQSAIVGLLFIADAVVYKPTRRKFSEHMVEEAYKNADDMPISDILTEIRQLVSAETSKRYDRDRELAVTELLILRPEARVDLVLKEPDVADLHVKDVAPKPDTDTLGITSRQDLEKLIRKIFHEEFEQWTRE